MSSNTKPIHGFTFIEVIIVVAIVTLIAIISLTHYEKAMTSSKLSEAREQLRYTSIGLEAYKVDQGKYPYDGYMMSGPGIPGYTFWYVGISISTPIAYLPSNDLDDPFRSPHTMPADYIYNNIRYINVGSSWGTDYTALTGRISESVYYDDMLNGTGGWRLLSVGPDNTYGPTGWDMGTNYPASATPLPYDPTNGLQSDGDLTRCQKYIHGYYNVP